MAHPALPDRVDTAAWWILLLFALAAGVSTAAGSVTLALLLLLLLFTPFRTWGQVRRDPLLYISLAFLAFLALRLGLAVWEWPEDAPEQWDAAKGWAMTGFLTVLATGLWVARRPDPDRTVRILLLCLLAGFLAGVVYNTPLEWVDNILRRRRHDFGFVVIEAGLYFGISLMGILLFSQAILSKRKMVGQVLLSLGLAGLGLVLFVGLVSTQTRGGWLAFAMVVPFALGFLLWPELRRKGVLGTAKGKAGLLAALVVVVLGTVWKWDLISKGALKEGDVYLQLWEKGLDEAPLTSVTKRLHMWRWGLARWQERPFIGWGPRNLHFIAEQGPVIEKLPRLSQLHNTYMDILTRFGLIGLGLYVLQWLLILRGAYLGYRGGIIGRDVATFLVGAWAMLLIWSFFDVRLNHPAMSFFVAIIGGTAYGAGMRARRERAGRAVPEGRSAAEEGDGVPAGGGRELAEG